MGFTENKGPQVPVLTMISQALSLMYILWQRFPGVSSWAGHILLSTVVETSEMTEKEKIIQIFMRGNFMHIFHKNKAERAFKTELDRLSENTSLFPLLPSFCSREVQAKKAKKKRVQYAWIRSADEPRGISEPVCWLSQSKKNWERGEEGLNFLIWRAF